VLDGAGLGRYAELRDELQRRERRRRRGAAWRSACGHVRDVDGERGRWSGHRRRTPRARAAAACVPRV